MILKGNLSGTLNNQKWIKIFSFLEDNSSGFKIKLLNGGMKKSDFIREITGTSILIDDSGDFVDFLEIEQLIVEKRGVKFIELLKLTNVEFGQTEAEIIIEGYKK